MTELTHIGLDVHKDTIAMAVLRPGTTEVDERVIPNTPEAVRRLLRRYPDPSLLSTCYEAGPTGYDTHRLITSLDIACDVIAPSLIPRRSGSRVKTDRINARNLARLHRAGELTPVRVPTSAEEAVRDLIRVREEVKSDRRIARQRIRSFLMRYGKRYPGPNDKWSVRFEAWMRAALRRAIRARGVSAARWRLLRARRAARRHGQAHRGARAHRALRRTHHAPERASWHRHAHRDDDHLRDVRLLTASARRAPSWRSPGSSLPSTRAGRAGTRDLSPRPGTATYGVCSWNQRGPTGTRLRCAASSRNVSKGRAPRSSPTRGPRSADFPGRIARSLRERAPTPPWWLQPVSSRVSSGASCPTTWARRGSQVMQVGGRRFPERSSITLCDVCKRAPSLRQAPVRPRCGVKIPGYQHGRAPFPCARPLASTRRQRGP